MQGNELLLNRVYAAVADPTRRDILAALSEGETNVGGLAARFPISFNGVSKHVKILERAGLVKRTIRGREHRLRLRAAPLREAAGWFQHYRAFWEYRLDALEGLLIAKRRSDGAAKRKRNKGVRR